MILIMRITRLALSVIGRSFSAGDDNTGAEAATFVSFAPAKAMLLSKVTSFREMGRGRLTEKQKRGELKRARPKACELGATTAPFERRKECGTQTSKAGTKQKQGCAVRPPTILRAKLLGLGIHLR